MLAMRRSNRSQSILKPVNLESRPNAPPVTLTCAKLLLSVLCIAGLFAVMLLAAEPTSARYDPVFGMARARALPAWQQFRHARWPYHMPAGNRMRARQGPHRRVCRSDDDRAAESAPYRQAPCMSETEGGSAGTVGMGSGSTETTGAAAPVRARHSHPMPAAGSIVASAAASAAAARGSSAVGWPALLAGQVWIVVAVILLLATLWMPGAAVGLWFFGLAGFVVSGTALATDLTWQYQVGIFAVLGVGLCTLWARFDRVRGNGDRKAGLPVNGRGPTALVGRVFRLEKPIEGGEGMLTADGTAWRITGRDCAAGKRVKVTRAEGTLLVVDPVEC